MKKFTLLFTVLFAAFVINAQNVAINNDGSNATASAMLDVKSTTSHDYLVARIIALERYNKYVQSSLVELTGQIKNRNVN